MKPLISLLVFLLIFTALLRAESDSTRVRELEKRVQQLEERLRADELEKLKAAAEAAAGEKKSDTPRKVFSGGQRALQALNPEISLVGDGAGIGVLNRDGFNEQQRSGMHFRVAELQIQSTLDPFSTAKFIIEVTPEEVELAEAYLTWQRFLPSVALTAGKFRQQFGVINRWHEHSLDQQDYPLPLTTFFGEEGLVQTGVSLDWFMPGLFSGANRMILQVTNGGNEELFAGELFSFPVGLLHLQHFRELNRSSFLELGFSGLLGGNQQRGYLDGELLHEPLRMTRMAGADLTFRWEPVNRSKYRSFLWRSEIFFLEKETAGAEKIRALGGYSGVEYKFRQGWLAGLRLDYTQPPEPDNGDRHLYQLVPYMTWWQSEWVRLRLQLNHRNGPALTAAENTLLLQVTWALGPHKHERY